MKLGFLTICGMLLLTMGVVHAQEAAKPTTRPASVSASRPAAASQPTSVPATRPTASQPASVPASQPAVDENELVEIDVKDLPVIAALRTARLLKNVDQFTLSIAFFANTRETNPRETAVLAVTVADKAEDGRDGGGRGRDEQGNKFTAAITRRTASLIVRQLLWDGFLEKAENLQRQRPPAPDAGYLLVVTGMGTADLYEVLPYNAATLERLKELRKLLDENEKAAAAFDKAIEKIANDKQLPE